eukprot:354206-Chlamydomonas_euryale.AAC.8
MVPPSSPMARAGPSCAVDAVPSNRGARRRAAPAAASRPRLRATSLGVTAQRPLLLCEYSLMPSCNSYRLCGLAGFLNVRGVCIWGQRLLALVATPHTAMSAVRGVACPDSHTQQLQRVGWVLKTRVQRRRASMGRWQHRCWTISMLEVM